MTKAAARKRAAVFLKRREALKITVLCVGKVKESYFTDAIREYMKCLSRYAKTEIVEVEDEKTPDSASDAENEAIKAKEGGKLLSRLPEDAYVIALAIEGKAPDSVELSRKIETLGIRGKSHLCFVIGGSLGLSKVVTERADELLSFSRMTFPHQLMRVILLEQLYRSFRIMKGEPYHK